MNDDNYVEWLVKRKDPAYAVPVKYFPSFQRCRPCLE